MTDTKELRARCQSATADEQREVLEEVWEFLAPTFRRAGLPDVAHKFATMLDATAYESAALLLMREVLPGWRRVAREESDHFFVRIHSPDFDSVTWGKGENWITDVLTGREASAKASTEALAILSAILTAKENENG